jgi:pSer/pThr/pTyr-binding forkhead associated (FHA) protein
LLSDRPVYLLSDDRPTSIGRGAVNDVVVDEEHVSQQHARVFYRDAGFWVEDLQSTNGTYINGVRIEGTMRLTTGDLLKIGAMILRFELLGPS